MLYTDPKKIGRCRMQRDLAHETLGSGNNCFLWADQYAKMTADTFFAIQNRMSFIIKCDCLMSTISTGNGAASASNAPITYKRRENDGVPFQMVCCPAD